MARKSKADAAKEKEAKQKKIAIGGAVVLVLLLAIQGPKTMKMLHSSATAPVTSTGPVTTTPTSGAPPSDPNSLAAPTLGGTAAAAPTTTSSDLVSAVPVTADPGQLQTFEKFATKDPFAAQVSGSGGSSSSTPPASGGSSSSGASTTPTLTTVTPPATPTSAAPAPTTAVIKLNGELSSVAVGTDFPTAGATFSQVGAIFHLVSLTAKTAKIAIVGGSYADGAPAITLHLNTPLTLQNTADGTKYTLVLLPATTQVTGAATGTAGTTSTTPSLPVVPSSGSGG